MTEGRRLDEVRRWLKYAGDDLRLTEVILSQSIGAPWQACFHAQQAAEKALKAALVFDGMPVPRSHDLVELVQRLPARWAGELDVGDLKLLSEWAVEPRYPDALIDATTGDARWALEQAHAVWDAIIQTLAQRGFDVSAEFP